LRPARTFESTMSKLLRRVKRHRRNSNNRRPPSAGFGLRVAFA